MGLAFLQKVLPVAIAVFSVVALFHLITLPVEFDASRRAKQQLTRLGLVQNQENLGVNRVLHAAALTYVAAMVSSVFTVLHLVMLTRGDD